MRRNAANGAFTYQEEEQVSTKLTAKRKTAPPFETQAQLSGYDNGPAVCALRLPVAGSEMRASPLVATASRRPQ